MRVCGGAENILPLKPGGANDLVCAMGCGGSFTNVVGRKKAADFRKTAQIDDGVHWGASPEARAAASLGGLVKSSKVAFGIGQLRCPNAPLRNRRKSL